LKVIKAKIYKKREIGHCHFEYPKRWDASRIQVLAYEDHPKNLGNQIEYCIATADEDIADAIILDGEAEEITIKEAKKLGKEWGFKI